MNSRAGTFSFGLFVVVLLAAVFWLLHQQGRPQWGVVAVLLGILVLRAVLFTLNLRHQRRNVERGRGPVQIETRLGLGDEAPQQSAADGVPPGENEPRP